MRVVLQRVSTASVTVNGLATGSIEHGLVILLGIAQEDTATDVSWLADKIIALRIFSDEQGMMNRSLQDIHGSILLISQFTLFAQTKKGNRPSFIRAAKPATAIPLYELMIEMLETRSGKRIATGLFGADMKLQLVNDGPVTITIDSRMRE